MNQEEIKRASKDKLQEYGREGLAPIMELFSKYGDEIVSYIKHFETGLDEGAASLEGEGAEAEKKQVATWLREGAKWVSKLENRLESGDSEALLSFIDEQGKNHPAALFASSLIAGGIVGAIGKQAYKADPSENDESVGQSELNQNQKIH